MGLRMKLNVLASRFYSVARGIFLPTLTPLALFLFASQLPGENATVNSPLPTQGNSRLWPRLKPAENPPVNLANKSIFGCTISSSQGVKHAEALITTDPAEDFVVPVGKGEVVINLGGQRVINNIDFINDHIASALTVSTSTDNHNWKTVTQVVILEHQRQFEAEFGGVQCKYVRLAFDTSHGGELRGFDFYGPEGRKDFHFKTAAEAGSNASDENFNLAAAGVAVPIYAFPTPTNSWETGMLHHVFRFPKTNEKYRTIVYDLGSAFTIKQLTIAYTQRPVRVEAFLFEQAAEKKDWRGRLSFDPSILDKTKPYGVFEDAEGHGHVKFKQNGDITARYVVFRYEPDYNRKPATALLNLHWSDLLAVFGPAASLVGELIPRSEEHRMVAGDTDAPFEHNDTDIIPVGSFVLMPPPLGTTHEDSVAAYTPFFNPGWIPGGNVSSAIIPPINVPPASP